MMETMMDKFFSSMSEDEERYDVWYDGQNDG